MLKTYCRTLDTIYMLFFVQSLTAGFVEVLTGTRVLAIVSITKI